MGRIEQPSPQLDSRKLGRPDHADLWRNIGEQALVYHPVGTRTRRQHRDIPAELREILDELQDTLHAGSPRGGKW